MIIGSVSTNHKMPVFDLKMCAVNTGKLKAERIDDDEPILELKPEIEFNALVEGVIMQMRNWVKGYKCRRSMSHWLHQRLFNTKRSDFVIGGMLKEDAFACVIIF